MSNCDELRERIIATGAARNRAQQDNARAENEGRPLPYSWEDLAELRAAVHMAARAARQAGCDISDLVGDNVGNDDSPL